MTVSSYRSKIDDSGAVAKTKTRRTVATMVKNFVPGAVLDVLIVAVEIEHGRVVVDLLGEGELTTVAFRNDEGYEALHYWMTTGQVITYCCDLSGEVSLSKSDSQAAKS